MVDLGPDLLRRVEEKARSQGTDVTTFARWCILTGLFLGDVNKFVRTKMAQEAGG